MQAATHAKFGYRIAAMCDMTGRTIYRYTILQREPEEQHLLYGFKNTQEEATEIAEKYARIATEAWQQHYAS